MGFFERDVESSLDSLFDLNRDGKIGPVEQALILDFITGDDEDESDDDDDRDWDRNYEDSDSADEEDDETDELDW